MSRKNLLTLRRGTTTVIAEGCYAITCLTVMAVTYIIFAPFRLAGKGISRLTQSFSGGLLTNDDE
jgi:hypothetical protein